MDFNAILLAVAVISVLGLLIGLFLGIAGEKLKVEVNEKEIEVRECLPGNNCGGCGFAGCDALAKAIADGKAEVGACPVGGKQVADKIAAVMGVEAGEVLRMAAVVRCKGTCDNAKSKYNYVGINDCRDVTIVPGAGDKACSFGCLGYGTCASVCDNDAITVIDGVAVVDKEKCIGCGKCIKACPKHVIELIPYDAEHVVKCSSKDKGKTVKDICKTGCIGCSLCAKNCENEAITMVDNLPQIDYSKCTGCGKCAEKCPVKVIS
ncbi:MAG: RnfABCDGE type electron transport complex subunit B [Lachnospiraceae bacterium]|nr:RnfABCDGE type electron transport complex subunit B [Lachnospiraceae bacterium]